VSNSLTNPKPKSHTHITTTISQFQITLANSIHHHETKSAPNQHQTIQTCNPKQNHHFKTQNQFETKTTMFKPSPAAAPHQPSSARICRR
jgi:hypothetical protein